MCGPAVPRTVDGVAQEDDPPEVTDVLADEEGRIVDAQEASHGDEQGRT